MAVWKFQLLPHEPNVVGLGYRMDAVGVAVENEVNDALPYRFRFHKISKLVLALGPGTKYEQEYAESLGVAIKVVPEFSLRAYVRSSDARKTEMLQLAILSEFEWFERNFEDAQFIAKAREGLAWAA